MEPNIVKRNRDGTLENINTRSIKIAHNILIAFVVIQLFFVLFFSIYLWATAKQNVTTSVVNSYTGKITATNVEVKTNVFQVFMGFMVLLFGTTMTILEWFLLKPIIGMLYDIKLIRYHFDAKEEAQNNTAEKENTQTNDQPKTSGKYFL